ncbi:MAG: roadblock/LC7 domain-containing protein [Cyanobacteriota bacterium]|nr:roadblock/LC7 domain-containing protein [Cyanobacteriota bacterium]
MNNKSEIIIQKLVKTGSVIDAVLVSHQAELITNPMGEWDEESITGMAAAMLFLTDTTGEHLGWSPLEQMWLQAKENYFIGIRCDNEVFLLVKAINNSPLGGLRMAINRTVKALKTALDSEVILDGEKITPDSYNGEPPDLEGMEGKEVMWRGRKLQS